MGDVVFFHAQREELLPAGCGQSVGHAFIETRLHNADGKLFAVQVFGPAFFCIKHDELSWEWK